MKKLLIALIFFAASAIGMEKPTVQPQPKRNVPWVYYSTGKNECEKWLTQGKDYKTSTALWDPIAEKETITAYHKNREVGHITFSDNIPQGSPKNSATHGFIHSFNVVPELRGQHIGFDLFNKMCSILKNRGVCLVTWYVSVPTSSKYELKKLESIFYHMAHRLPYRPQFSKGAILFRDGLIGRRLQIQFKHEPSQPLPPLKKRAIAATGSAQDNADSVPVLPPSRQELPAQAIDFLKEYVCEEKQSGDKLTDREELEFTKPVQDDLYDKSYTIELRKVDTQETVGQATYGQEIGDNKGLGAIHYYYVKPNYYYQYLGYPLFKRVVQELKKLGYTKITWQAFVENPPLGREAIYKSFKDFGHQIKADEDMQPVIDNNLKKDYVTMYLTH